MQIRNTTFTLNSSDNSEHFTVAIELINRYGISAS